MSYGNMNFYVNDNFNDSTLLPKKIRDQVLFRERVIKPTLASSVQRPRQLSPFTNHGKIKDILGLIQARKSGLEKYRIPKISTNKIIQKHTKNRFWIETKKYSILPKIKTPSVERLEATETPYCEIEHDEENTIIDYGKIKTERRIVLSKLSNQSVNLWKNRLMDEYGL